MRSTFKCRLIGAAVIAILAGWSAAVSTARGPLPEPVYSKVIEADIAHLNKLAELSKTRKGVHGRMRITAVMIAAYAQDNLAGSQAAKMATLRTEALKAAELASKKDTAGAGKIAKGLSSLKADSKANTKPIDLIQETKLGVDDVMHIFGGSTAGGMNLEKDIQTAAKSGVKDVAAAEIIGARSAILADLTLASVDPSMFGGKKTKSDWERWVGDMKKNSVDIVTEAAKGEKADKAKLKRFMSGLDASCTNCHNVFRD